MRIKQIITICLLFVSSALFAQEKIVEITGVVKDAATKEPMVGVNVIVKDQTGHGTTTDVNGQYKIKVEQYSRLVYSFIGYDLVEVLVKDQKHININLKESEAREIDEVVITGSGAEKKLTVTGAVTNVDVETMKSNPTSNLSNALAGNVAGVLAMQTSGQPGVNTSEFWIRGISTFGANSSALVLVDGFERSLDEINIEDIETFSVLKDASETAIYGSRGANGVILITTKRGKAGKINISIKAETAYNTRTMMPDFADGASYASMMNEARITRNQEPIYTSDELEIIRLGLDQDIYPNVNWRDVLLKDGAMSYRGNINMSGGGNTARYFVSLSYANEQGMYKTDDALRNDYNTNPNNQRYNYRLNTDINVTKTTILKVGVAGSLNKRNAPGQGANVWYSLMGQNPISIPVMYSNGYIPSYGTMTNRKNPWVLATQTGYQEIWTNKIQTNLTLEQNLSFITKGLSFTGHLGFDTDNSSHINRLRMPETWRAERDRDDQGNLVFKQQSAEEPMAQSASSSGSRREFLELWLNYRRSFSGHNVGAVLKFNSDASRTTTGIGSDIKNGIAQRHMGVAGRVSYNWRYRYFVNFNFGYNGSENFADGHRFGFFPAVSAAWNIGEEAFVKKHMKWINMFKVRYSFGKVGNDRTGERFPYLYSIEDTGSGWNWADYDSSDNVYTGMVYTQLASNAVTWEIATKHDVGIDFSFFNDKLTGTVDYFNDTRDGIFMARNYLPGIVGVTSAPKANVGSVNSHGFDGNFAYKQRLNKVNITVRGNFTYSKNKILAKDEENAVYPYQNETGYRVSQAKGLVALGLFKDYDDIRNSPQQQWGKVQPGDIKYKDVNGDGVVDNGDRVAIGATVRPNFIYGFGVSLQWKGFDFNLHFQGAGKSSFFINGPSVYAFNTSQWGNVLSNLVKDRYVDADTAAKMGIKANENPNASYPRLSYGGNENNYQNSTFWQRDGSYLRLKTFEVGYSVPKRLSNKIKVGGIRIFFVGTNLLTFSKFKEWDPELGSSNGEKYPLSRTYSFGLRFNI